MKAYQYEGLSGWDMSFRKLKKWLNLRITYIFGNLKNKKNILRDLTAIYIHSLSSIEEREKLK